jgi:hypothetical protein
LVDSISRTPTFDAIIVQGCMALDELVIVLVAITSDYNESRGQFTAFS